MFIFVFINITFSSLSSVFQLSVLSFHLLNPSANILVFCHSGPSFPLQLLLQSFYFISRKGIILLGCNKILIVGPDLINFGFKLLFKLPHPLLVKHAFSSLIFYSLFQPSDVTISSQEGLLSIFKFLFLLIYHLLHFSQPVLVDCALPPFILNLISQEIQLFFRYLDLVCSSFEFFIFLVQFLNSFLQKLL